MSETKKSEKKAPSMVVKTVGAMVGGAVEAVALQPLDVLKTRLQIGGGQESLKTLATSMLRNEGPLSFYKGLTPFLTHLVTKYSVRWYFNDFYRGLLADKQGKVSTVGGFVAGLGAGMTEAVLIVTPFEVIKTRLQQQKGLDRASLKYKGPVDCVKIIIKEEGATALWKGVAPTMVRQGWNQFFLFGTYDPLKKLVYGLEKSDPVSTHQSITIGVIAGALGPLTNNPFDVAKTRLMAQKEVGDARKYTGMFQCIFKIFREEGPVALMKGCGMRILRVAPGMGITFTVVEKFTQYFD